MYNSQIKSYPEVKEEDQIRIKEDLNLNEINNKRINMEIIDVNFIDSYTCEKLKNKMSNDLKKDDDETNLKFSANRQDIQKKLKILKRKRRTKNEEMIKNHKCNICHKSYYSYPALYTHKRNKHNIIPITGKEEMFKKVIEKNKNLKFKYSALENDNQNFSELLNNILKIYKSNLLTFFNDENCILFQNNFNPKDHIGINILKKIKEQKIENLVVPSPETNPSIDEILIIYLVFFIKVVQDRTIIDLVIKFVILLREHINIVGWDFKKKFKEFGIKIEFKFEGPYTLLNGCEEVPDFINEFVSVFTHLDDRFVFPFQNLIDLSKNFCNWLFVNNLTSFKICPNEQNFQK